MQYLPRPTCLPTRSLIHNGACRPRWVCVSLSLRLTLPSTAAVQLHRSWAYPIGLIPLDCKWDASREFIRFGRRDGDRKHDHWHEWHYCNVGILVCPKHPSGFKSIEAVCDPQSMISDHRAPSLPSIHPSSICTDICTMQTPALLSLSWLLVMSCGSEVLILMNLLSFRELKYIQQ